MAVEASSGGFSQSYYGEGGQEPRNWWSALATSSVLYVAIGVLVTAVGLGTRRIVTERPVEIEFVEKVAKVEPPPVAKPIEPKPVPPKVVPESKKPAAAAIVPKGMKIRKLDRPMAPTPLTAPTDMPLDAAPEADASLDKGVGVYGDYVEGDVAGLEGGVEGGTAGGVYGALPDGATAPRPSRGNAQPKYPREARKAGKVGLVRLKVIITAAGHVEDIQLVQGDEPFASEALQAVKRWRYQPAEFQGDTIAVRRMIEVHFKLRA